MMIKYLLILLFSFSTVLGADVFDSDVDIRVKGLVCPSCAIGLKNSFKRHVNVKGLKVDTKKGILSLKYWSVAIPSPEIKKMVKDSGYEVSSIKCK